MKKAKIPTLIGLFILLVSLIAGLFAIRQLKIFKSDASTNFSPKDVRITNVTDTSFTVTWLTDAPSIGFVEYSNNGNVKLTPPTSNSKTHLATLQRLNPTNLYTFRINSNGQFFINNQVPWSAQTLTSQIPAESIVISGKVLNENGFPAKEALIFVDALSLSFSTQVSPSGNWILSLPALPDTTVLQVLVETSTSSVALAKVDIKGANPVPPIKIGNSYDFRNQETGTKNDTPRVDFNLP